MSRATIELNLRTAFGLAFVVIGLAMLAYVSLMAFQLAIGVIQPLKVSEQPIGYGNEILYGIMLQIGMFGLLVVVAYILMKFGFTLILQKTESK